MRSIISHFYNSKIFHLLSNNRKERTKLDVLSFFCCVWVWASPILILTGQMRCLHFNEFSISPLSTLRHFAVALFYEVHQKSKVLLTCPRGARSTCFAVAQTIETRSSFLDINAVNDTAEYNHYNRNSRNVHPHLGRIRNLKAFPK